MKIFQQNVAPQFWLFFTIGLKLDFKNILNERAEKLI